MSSELQNIPPLWTAVFHWLAFLLYVHLLPKKQSAARGAVTAAVLLGVMFPYMTLIAPLDGALFNLGMTGFAVLTLLPFLLLTTGTLYSHVYYCARAFILGGFTVSLAWQLYSYYSRYFALLRPVVSQAVFMLVLVTLIYAGMYFLESSHRNEVQEMSIPPRACAGAVVIAVINYILSSLSYTAIDSPFTTHLESEAFNIRTLVYLGGVAVILGPTGKNFAAGMSGGIAYVLDEKFELYLRLNKDMVTMSAVTAKHDAAQLKKLIENHVAATGSARGQTVLDNWDDMLPLFKKITPNDYSRMLTAIAQFEEKGMPRGQAELEAFYAVQKGGK